MPKSRVPFTASLNTPIMKTWNFLRFRSLRHSEFVLKLRRLSYKSFSFFVWHLSIPYRFLKRTSLKIMIHPTRRFTTQSPPLPTSFAQTRMLHSNCRQNEIPCAGHVTISYSAMVCTHNYVKYWRWEFDTFCRVMSNSVGVLIFFIRLLKEILDIARSTCWYLMHRTDRTLTYKYYFFNLFVFFSVFLNSHTTRLTNDN